MEKFATITEGPTMKLLIPKDNQITKYLKNIKNSLKELKKLNIAHIDLKLPNTGYSKKDKVWKIFDFDISGIYNNKNKWTVVPPYENNIWTFYRKFKTKSNR